MYFLENALLDALLLLFVLLLMGKKIRGIRLLTAALLGAAFTVGLVIAGARYGIGYLAATFLMGNLMVAVAGKETQPRQLLTGTCYFYALSYVLGRLLVKGSYLIGSSRVLALLVIAVMGSAVGCLLYQKRCEQRRVVYPVQISSQGQQITVQALFDTGNALCEPISGKPVSIVEKESLKEIGYEQKPEKCRVIPFRSIGKEHGILRGIEVDELIIWKGEQKVVQRHAMIALYEGQLSQDGSFQMILHQRLG